MRRAASFLTLGGIVAVVSWTLARASPFAHDPVFATVSPSAPPSAVSLLDAEVTKLHDRAERLAPFTPAARDPFKFGPPPVPPGSRRAGPEPPAPPSPPPAPTLPKLVAITSKDTPGGAVRTAAFSIGDNVLVARPGDTVGTLVVRVIADGFVELVDPGSGIAYRVR
jgi:hypothetical protein